MSTIIVKRDYCLDFEFSGEKIASARSSENTASSPCPGHPGIWTELALYRSEGGKYICSRIEHTIWEGDRTRYSGAVCDTGAQIMEFFGTGWLAKCLYEKAEISASSVEIK